MAGLTPKLPLALSSDDGAYQLIKTYKNLVKQNFKNLILTSPGERIMDPHFGVGIRNFLFENDGQQLYSEISSKIKNHEGEGYTWSKGGEKVKCEKTLIEVSPNGHRTETSQGFVWKLYE